MSNLVSIWSETDAAIIGDDSTPGLTLSNTSTGPGLLATKPVSASAPTVAPLQVIMSTASGAFIDFRGAVISTASLALTGPNVVGLVRVWFQGSAGNAAGWLPIFKDAIAL